MAAGICREPAWLGHVDCQQVDLKSEDGLACRVGVPSERYLVARSMESKDVECLKNVYKPTWWNSQLAMSDAPGQVGMPGAPAYPLKSALMSTSTAAYKAGVTVEDCTRLCEMRQLTEAVAALGLLVQTRARVSTAVFDSVLKLCLAEEDLVLGRQVHALAVEAGYQSNTFLANQILRMYASLGRLEEARKVFSQVTDPNTYLWYSIISAHAEHGEPKQAIALYEHMLESPVKPNSYIFVAALRACAASADLEYGRQVHSEVLKAGMVSDVYVGSCLVDMYSKCSRLEAARKVFDGLPSKNVVTWNSMINGYAEHGLGQKALALYARMEQEGVIVANSVTFACLLKACMSFGALQEGKDLHSKLVEQGLGDDTVIGNCLVVMYAKCGSLDDARSVFDNLSTRTVVTWNSMINGYAENGFGQEALALYTRMEREGIVVADNLIFACLLKACTGAGALQQGKQLHAQIVERGLEDDMILGNCLVDMYGKCGSLPDARRVFDSLPKKDVITWTAMLNGCGQCSAGQEAVQCFQEMLQEGVQPDEITFIRLLVACSHDGLVNEGRRYFKDMVEKHHIMPSRQHYACLVDLLGRAGELDEAERVLLCMPFQSDVIGWKSLLSACRRHGDMERGRRCFETVVGLEPQHASAYVLMANIYADAGRWIDVETIENLRKSVGANKKPGKAGIEVNRQVHTFVVGEEGDGISSKVTSMSVRLKQDGGHMPHTELVLKAVPERDKEDKLCGHAEKLALAYGLLNTPDGTPLLVTKNLRMCSDCHSATQIMSRIEKREIVVRDAHRIHRFVEGSCCCGSGP